ncbi:hypothetical protein [Haloarcula salina]|nr:hypothetical protein [Haloarcula salina]
MSEDTRRRKRSAQVVEQYPTYDGTVVERTPLSGGADSGRATADD